MEFICNPNSKKAKKIVRKYGFGPEHNFDYISWNNDENHKACCAVSGKNAILAVENLKSNYWEIENGIIAHETEQVDVLKEFLDSVFKKRKTKKVFVETSPELRARLLKEIKKYKVGRVNFDLIWPVYYLPKWDHRLKGKDWKKVRNLINRLKSQHRVRVVDSREVDNDELKLLIKKWMKKRLADDHVNKSFYSNLVDTNFKGTKFCRSVIVDGEPCTITAGWKIPNSKDYYSAIGISNFKYEGLGEFANIDDLRNIKRNKFEYADFGGSDEDLLKFKKKFKPFKTYSTLCYSIMRK